MPVFYYRRIRPLIIRAFVGPSVGRLTVFLSERVVLLVAVLKGDVSVAGSLAPMFGVEGGGVALYLAPPFPILFLFSFQRLFLSVFPFPFLLLFLFVFQLLRLLLIGQFCQSIEGKKNKKQKNVQHLRTGRGKFAP